MAVREKINRVKIEQWRLSRVPCDPTETIYQGDHLMWDATNRRATKGVAAGIAASGYIGMSDKSNQMPTAGSTEFLTDTQESILNVIQQGLVEVVWGASETVYPFDEVVLGVNAQTCVKGSGAAVIGVVDMTVGSAGRAVVAGDVVNIWLRVHDRYKVS